MECETRVHIHCFTMNTTQAFSIYFVCSLTSWSTMLEYVSLKLDKEIVQLVCSLLPVALS